VAPAARPEALIFPVLPCYNRETKIFRRRIAWILTEYTLFPSQLGGDHRSNKTGKREARNRTTRVTEQEEQVA
jgi:hypothetical protein